MDAGHQPSHAPLHVSDAQNPTQLAHQELGPITGRDLVVALNLVAHQSLERLDPTEWDENHISFCLVRALRDTLSLTGAREQSDESPTTRMTAEAYKISGAMEQTYGDIVVAITDADRGLTGFGYYEAKAANEHGQYPAFNMRQLRRLTTTAPRLSLLLYEQVPCPVQDDDLSFTAGDLLESHARVRALGANLASRFPDPAFSFLRPQSFGQHFVTRYLSGRDLDYSREPQKALSRWLRVTRRAPPLLISIAISGVKTSAPSPLVDDYVPLPPTPTTIQLPVGKVPRLG